MLNPGKFPLTTYLRFATVPFLKFRGTNPRDSGKARATFFLSPRDSPIPSPPHLSNSPFPFLPPESKGAYGKLHRTRPPQGKAKRSCFRSEGDGLGQSG